MASILLVAALAAAAAAHPVLESRQEELPSFGDFIADQFTISLESALLNIGGVNGNVVEGALPGFVVASPSTVNPNYFYTWTRDSALTQLMITDELIFGTEEVGNNTLQVVVEQYTTAQAQLQTVTNPSGSLWPAGLGLGEPKYYSNGTRFNDPWGRPQNDGPGLRASAMMEIAEAIYIRNPQWATIVSNVYWPIIYNDLLYVGQYWNSTAYDLWEEVGGNSFFTTTAQHRALVQGSIWAERLNQTCEPCQQAPQIACFLANDFWNETGNYIIADINTGRTDRSGVNADPILAAMHAFDINATCDAAALQPCNSKTLATHKVWVDSFRNLYPINNNATAPEAVLTGRYPEDTYYDGNPWYITTYAAAEVLYDAAAQFLAAGEVTIDNTSLPFWQDLYPDADEYTYKGVDAIDLVSLMTEYADGFINATIQYTPSNGTLNEQINKTTGEPTSAIALTWSFAAFVTAIERREGNYPPSWGADSIAANNVSETCAFSSYNGTTQYTPALAANASSVPMDCESEVLFRVTYATGDGENMYMVGNNSFFGDTLDDTDNVYAYLRTLNKTDDDPLFYEPAWLPAGETLEYKYVLVNNTAVTFTFENITRYVTPAACGNNTVVETMDVASFPE